VKNKPQYAIESVDKALHLAQLLLLEGPMRVTDVAAQLNVSVSTAHRLLAMLVYRDFAEQGEGKRYRAGAVLRSATSSDVPVALLRRAGIPHLQRLADRVNETANLLVLSGTQVRFVHTIECRQLLRVGDRAGKALPAHLTCAGKAMLSILDEPTLEEVLAQLADDGERARLRRTLRAARQNGFALNNQQTETGVMAIGVAMRWKSMTAASVTLAMPSARFEKDKLEGWIRALRECANRVEDALGRESDALDGTD
jgi:DNA-binding IclR family transcriptional regulator